jgi:PAS domain S-box-containing protein
LKIRGRVWLTGHTYLLTTMLKQMQRRRWRFGVAILVFVLSGLLRVLLHPILGLTVLYTTFFGGIMLSAWYGGLAPGLLTTVLSAIAALIFLLKPLYPFGPRTLSDATGLLLFILVGFLISYLNERLHRSQWQLAEARSGLARMGAVVESSNEAMTSWDLEQRITSWNPAAERLSGYSADEVVGSPISTLIAPGGVNPADELTELLREGENIGIWESTLVRKSGETVEVAYTVSPVRNESGELLGVSSILRDITERNRADNEISRLTRDLEDRVAERTAELTAANSELEAFSFSVSHDLRAPLRHIAGFSKIVAEESGGELSPESRRYLQRVQDGAQDMGIMIDDLLNLARVGRQVIARRPFPVNNLVKRAIDELTPDAEGRDIDWQVDTFGSVECDPGLAKLVFVNLLSNALKYTRVRSRAVIHVGQTEINGERVIFVRDNGAGFDMAYSSKLFGVFQRLHKASDFEGTGVGLATVQRIIHKHGGRIWVDAEVDKGATFFFTIPDGPAPALALHGDCVELGGKR